VDQGIGMSAEVMAKIFDPYYTTKSAGHGRGLSVSHSIIQKHDGHIAVRSEQNVGTTFEFYLPTTLENPTTTTAPDREIAHGSGRILLMDDDKMILIAMMRGLEILGYEVESVYDGAATLQAYKTSVDEGKAYDIVIVDLTVPGTMGGQITAAKLHEIDPQLRIIVYSGYANNPVMANYEDYGFVDNLTKPIDIQELAQTTKRVMDMTDRGVMS
jgi:CheY-like chemotaxis protein